VDVYWHGFQRLELFSALRRIAGGALERRAAAG